MSVTPGVDPKKVSKRLDQLMADYLANGPTADEVQRAVMSEVSGRIRGLEQVGGFGGKAVSLAEGQTYAHDSDFYKKTLATYAAITPAAVRAQMNQWLKRPALTITITPGERPAYTEAKAVQPKPAPKDNGAVKGNRQIPPVGQLAALAVPCDHAHAPRERDCGRLRAAHGGAGDADRALVQCWLFVRYATESRTGVDGDGPA